MLQESIGNQTYYNNSSLLVEPFNRFKEGRLYYMPEEDVYLEVNTILRDENGNITHLIWTTYENIGYDTHEGVYIGVGVVSNGEIGNGIG